MSYIENHFKTLYRLKTICISLAIVTILLVSGYSIYNMLEHNKHVLKNVSDINFSNINLLEDTNISIQNLSLDGNLASNASYHITASQAVKNLQGNILMKDINLIYDKSNMADKITISSESGNLNELTNLVTIDKKSVVKFQDYSIYTTQLSLNLNDKSARSYNEIILRKGNSSYLKADSFTTSENSNYIYLQGNVKASIDINDYNQ